MVEVGAVHRNQTDPLAHGFGGDSLACIVAAVFDPSAIAGKPVMTMGVEKESLGGAAANDMDAAAPIVRATISCFRELLNNTPWI
jgi:hypothetical protein